MPRDFRSFANDNKKVMDDNQDKVNEYQSILDKYKNMDSNQLMANLFNEASKLRQEGKLDDSTLNNLKSTLSPFLNNEQQNMLNSLINSINEQK